MSKDGGSIVAVDLANPAVMIIEDEVASLFGEHKTPEHGDASARLDRLAGLMTDVAFTFNVSAGQAIKQFEAFGQAFGLISVRRTLLSARPARVRPVPPIAGCSGFERMHELVGVCTRTEHVAARANRSALLRIRRRALRRNAAADRRLAR